MKKRLTLVLLLWLLLALAGCGGDGADPAANWVLSEGRWVSYTTDSGLPNGLVRGLAVDAEGQPWVGTAGGGAWFDGSTWQVFAFPCDVQDIAFDAQGRAWLIGSYGLQVYEQGALTTHSEVEGMVSLAIMMDSQGRIWLGNIQGGPSLEEGRAGGISLFEDGQWKHFDTDDGLFSPTVWDLVEEPDGTVWAVGAGGVAWFDGAEWESMTLPGRPPEQEIPCVAVGPSGRIWFGAKRFGLWIWDGVEWTQYTSDDGLAGETVWDIGFDDAGRAWIGTGSGLSVFDGETWTTYTVEDGLVNNDVRALAFADDGVWIGTYDGVSYLTFDGAFEQGDSFE
ncbi:MAG: hypothetical protein PVH62_03270 [Anaerolineae bacterium]